MTRVLRGFIVEQNFDILGIALGELELSLDFDSIAIDHLHLALHSFRVSEMINPYVCSKCALEKYNLTN